MTTYDRCLNVYNGKHYLKIPYCDFVGMYDWLNKIGEKNKMQIRHIKMCFSGSHFAQVLGEQNSAHDPQELSSVYPTFCEHVRLDD